MASQISIGFITEGSTDERFLESIIQRTFEEVAFECSGEVEVLPLQYLGKTSGEFIRSVTDIAKQAFKKGITAICVHTDADDSDDDSAFSNKINPAFKHVKESEKDVCKNLVAIIPVQMTEAWMLADKQLLKDEIGTKKADEDLGIHKEPERYPDPKTVIKKAIRIARQELSKRRRGELKIEELYQVIGQKLLIEEIDRLASYQKFKDGVREAYRHLNYLN